MTIQLGGLVSGMDTDATIKKLMTVEKQKVDRFYQQKQILEWKRDDYRAINTKLLALRNTTFDLKLGSTYNGKKVEISDESVLTATATTDAPNGTHTIKVNSLLSGVTKISTTEIAEYKDTLGAQFGISGTISFELKGKDGVSHVYSYDTAVKSINDVVTDINANTETSGIRAYYSADGNRFSLATADKGSSEKIEVAADANQFLENTLKMGMIGGNTYSGTNASVDYDGATGIEFASNQFTLNEVNYDLKKAGETVAVTVSQDVDTAVKKIKAFVESYNTLIENFTTKLSEKRYYDYPPLTDEQKDAMSEGDIEKWEAKARSGILKGESMLQSTASNIRQIASQVLTDRVSSEYISDTGDLVGDAKYKSLSSIGIATAPYFKDSLDNGKLYIDETKLRAALGDNPDDVMKMFTLMQTEVKTVTVNGKPQEQKNYYNVGLGMKLYDTLTEKITQLTNKAGIDTSYSDNSLIGKELARVEKQIDNQAERMTAIEKRYWKQFSAMEEAMKRITDQGNWLMQKLGAGTGQQ